MRRTPLTGDLQLADSTAAMSTNRKIAPSVNRSVDDLRAQCASVDGRGVCTLYKSCVRRRSQQNTNKKAITRVCVGGLQAYKWQSDILTSTVGVRSVRETGSLANLLDTMTHCVRSTQSRVCVFTRAIRAQK